MAYTARLQFGNPTEKTYEDRKYLVTEFSIHTVRHHNGLRPDADKFYERIVFSLRVPQKSDLSLYRWYVEGMARSGHFMVETSQANNTKNKCKEIEFTDAYCFAISERYSVDDGLRELTLSIVTDKLKMKDQTVEKPKSSESVGSAFRGLVVTEDLLAKEGQSVVTSDSKCYTIQDFAYACHRERNSGGFPYGPTHSACIDFTVKLESADRGQKFYDYIDANEPVAFSFLFDTSTNGRSKLLDFVNSMIVRGYVVDIEENYDKDPDKYAASEQDKGKPRLMLMRVRILVSDIAIVSDQKDNKGMAVREGCLNWKISND